MKNEERNFDEEIHAKIEEIHELFRGLSRRSSPDIDKYNRLNRELKNLYIRKNQKFWQHFGK